MPSLLARAFQGDAIKAEENFRNHYWRMKGNVAEPIVFAKIDAFLETQKGIYKFYAGEKSTGQVTVHYGTKFMPIFSAVVWFDEDGQPPAGNFRIASFIQGGSGVNQKTAQMQELLDVVTGVFKSIDPNTVVEQLANPSDIAWTKR